MITRPPPRLPGGVPGSRPPPARWLLRERAARGRGAGRDVVLAGRSRPSDARPHGSVARFGWVTTRTFVLSCRPAPRRPSRGPSRLRRAALSQPLLVPRRSLGPGRPRRAGRGARAGRAGHHRPPGPLRRSPVLDGRGGGRAAPGDRDRDRAGRRSRAGPGRDRHPIETCLAAGSTDAGRCRTAGRDRGPARPSPPDPCPAAGPSHGREGGPPGDRRGAARPASRAARPGRDGLAEPVPDGVAGEPRGHEGRPDVHAGAAGGACGGRDRAVGLPGGGARAPAASG